MTENPEVLEKLLTKALVERPRSGFIAEVLAHPVYLLASRINAKYLEAVVRRSAVSTRGSNWAALLMTIGCPQRLAVVCRGHLSVLLVHRLICFRRKCVMMHYLNHATAVLSRMHFVGSNVRVPVCVSMWRDYTSLVLSVAFHPSAPYLATGSIDNTAKLWRLNADCSAVTCVSTLQGHSNWVCSVAFHPSAPYLATGSSDNTANLWRLNEDCSATTCVSMLQGHSDWVRSVAFHPSAPYLATGSLDNTAKLWMLNADCSAATCVSTLRGHSNGVSSVAFHPSAPYLATGSRDNTAKLWRLNEDCSAATCVYTLQKTRTNVSSVAFHPSEPYVLTNKLWR